MRTTFIILLSATLLAACGSNSARTKRTEPAQNKAIIAPPTHYTYRVKASYPHPADAYTQGLQYVDGTLWEGTGEYGESVVQTLNMQTGKAEVKFRLPQEEFGEGITLLRDTLYQLTWQSNTAHVYDLKSGQKIREHRYPGEGWGLTTDGEKLYMSDGTAAIYTLDPTTFRREKKTIVTFRDEPVGYLNELEWIDGRIWANVYTTDQILIINPTTGRAEGIIDLAGLLPEDDRTPQTDVLNGIAYDASTKRIFVTGKNWKKIFEIEILAQ